MISANSAVGGSAGRSRWLANVLIGSLLGVTAIVGFQLGVWDAITTSVVAVVRGVHATVGPVWIPMALLFGRALLVSARNYRTRWGHPLPSRSAGRELDLVSPLFPGLGFCGTVFGLWAGFGALEGDDLLMKLPELMRGIGTAMVSTLVGLTLWAASLALAAFVPGWSWARVHWDDTDGFRVVFDGREIGRGAAAVEMLVEAVRGRAPEALCVAFDRSIPADTRSLVMTAVWSQRDAELPTREVTLP